MVAGARRYPCLLIQIIIGINILFGFLYIIKRKDYSDSSLNDMLQTLQQLQAKDKPVYDPNFTKQPSSYVIRPPNMNYEMEVKLPKPTNTTERQAAAFIVLVRNSELAGMIQSMKDIGMFLKKKACLNLFFDTIIYLLEERFNNKFNYPWVFLNEEPFSEDFILYTTKASSGKTHYGLVGESMWGYPNWIDQTVAAKQRELMKSLPYGSSESYRHMCRFQRYIRRKHVFVFERCTD